VPGRRCRRTFGSDGSFTSLGSDGLDDSVDFDELVGSRVALVGRVGLMGAHILDPAGSFDLGTDGVDSDIIKYGNWNTDERKIDFRTHTWLICQIDDKSEY
jgi:hypothetical protein